MTKQEKIRAGREILYNARICLDANDHKGYAKHMSSMRDLLVEDLADPTPKPPTRKDQKS